MKKFIAHIGIFLLYLPLVAIGVIHEALLDTAEQCLLIAREQGATDENATQNKEKEADDKKE